MRIGKKIIGNNHLNRGQSLVEVLVVAAILGMILTAILSIVVIAVNNNRKVKARTVAVRLAQEGVDWVRSQRDGLPWIDFDVMAGSDATYCINDLSSTWAYYTSHAGACDEADPNDWFDSGTQGTVQFMRQLDFENNGTDDYIMTITVSWNERDPVEGDNTIETSIETNLVRLPR